MFFPFDERTAHRAPPFRGSLSRPAPRCGTSHRWFYPAENADRAAPADRRASESVVLQKPPGASRHPPYQEGEGAYSYDPLVAAIHWNLGSGRLGEQGPAHLGGELGDVLG